MQEDARRGVPLRAMWLSKVSFSFVAGGLSTVAVAWVFALHPRERWGEHHVDRSPRSYRIVPPGRRFFVGASFERGIGWLSVESQYYGRIPRPVADDPTLGPRLNRRSRRVEQVARAWLTVHQDLPETLRTPGEGLSRTASGWPALALSFDSRPQRYASTPPQPVLPMQPIWRGFLLDTGVYGAIWLAALLLAPGRVRRAIRLRRGACPTCGYALVAGCTPGCPECGWQRRPEPLTTPSP